MRDRATWTAAGSSRRLEGDFDVLVVGGGIIGAGTALDLASRGLAVALAERTDFAQGTSSRSTKLLHGGIRYLPQLHLRLVSEGLREQKVLARIADFLYRPLEFVIPLYDGHRLAGAPRWAAGPRTAPIALRAGLLAYDALGGPGRPGFGHRRLTQDEVVEALPRLRGEGLRGAFAYRDAQTDDARLVLTVVKTAVRRYGAVAAGRAEATRLSVGAGRFEVAITDRRTGEERKVTAAAVVAATGAFDPPTAPGTGTLRLVRSKGVHLLFPAAALGIGDRALVLPETDDGRVLYVIPWLGTAMAGTTDTPYRGDPEHPAGSSGDVEYLMRHLARYLDLSGAEPFTTFAGLRALGDTGAESTAEVSREHSILQPVPGYVQVAGGKLTTYRRIAAEAAGAVADHLGVSGASRTAALPLVGAGGHPPSMRRRLRAAGFAAAPAEAAVERYGTESERLARLVAAEPELAKVLGDGSTSLAEVAHAVDHEAAASVADVMLRRTRLAWLSPGHGRADAGDVVRIMGRRLGWDARRMDLELDELERELAAEGL